MKRLKASVWSGFITWLLGIGTILSFNNWAENKIFGMTFFDLLDYLTSNIMLPLGGLLIALFAGWVMKREHVKDELGLSHVLWFQLWLFLVRFVTPLAVIVVFLNALGLINVAG